MKFLRNATMLLSARILSYLFSAAFFVYAARILGPTNFGILGVAGSFVTLFLIFSDFGIHRYLNREVARSLSGVEREINVALMLKVILSCIMLALVVITSNVLKYEAYVKYVIYVLGFVNVFQSYQLLLNGLFRGMHRADLDAITIFFEAPLGFILGILILRLGKGVLGLAFLYLILKILSFMLSLYLYKSNIGNLAFMLPNTADIKNILRKSIPYGAFFFLGMTYIFIGTVMLSYFKDNQVVGFYQAAMGVVAFLLLIPDSLTEVIQPLMVNLYYSDKRKLYDTFLLTIKILFVTGALFSIFLWKYNHFVIGKLFGNDYSTSADILIWASLIILFRFVAYGLGIYLTACGYQNARTISVGLCTCMHIFMCLTLIPKFSYYGVAAAYLITNILLCVSYLVNIKARLKKTVPWPPYLKIIFIILVVWCLDTAMPYNIIYVKACLSVIIFSILTYILRVFTKDEINNIKSVVISNFRNAPA